MILNHDEILEEVKACNICISPFCKNNVGSNSYDVRLDKKLLWYTTTKFLDSAKENKTKPLFIPKDGLILYPNTLYLGSTIEHASSGNNLVPMIEGKSSLARLGIQVHITGGFGDIGFKGNWTLEIIVVNPVKIYYGMRIAQLYWIRCKPCDFLYTGKYQHSNGVVASRMFEEFEGGENKES